MHPARVGIVESPEQSVQLLAVVAAWYAIGGLCAFGMVRRGHHVTWLVGAALLGAAVSVPALARVAQLGSRGDPQATILGRPRNTGGRLDTVVVFDVDEDPCDAVEIVRILGPRVRRLWIAVSTSRDADSEWFSTGEMERARAAVAVVSGSLRCLSPGSAILVGGPTAHVAWLVARADVIVAPASSARARRLADQLRWHTQRPVLTSSDEVDQVWALGGDVASVRARPA